MTMRSRDNFRPLLDRFVPKDAQAAVWELLKAIQFKNEAAETSGGGEVGPAGPAGPAGAAGAAGADGATGPAGPAPSGTGFVRVVSDVLQDPAAPLAIGELPTEGEWVLTDKLSITADKVNIGFTGDYNSGAAVENFQIYKKFDISTMGGMNVGETTFFSGDIVNSSGSAQLFSANIFSCIADNDGTTTSHDYLTIAGADIGAMAGYSFVDGPMDWKGSGAITGSRMWAKNQSSNALALVLEATGLEILGVGTYSNGTTRVAQGILISQVVATGNMGGAEDQPHKAYGIYIADVIVAADGITNEAWSIYSASTAASYFAGQIQSAVASGTAPFIVASTDLVSNLNADLLDGNEASAFEAQDDTLDTLAALADSAGVLTNDGAGVLSWGAGSAPTGVDIAGDSADISGVNMVEQVGDPASPAAGHSIFYLEATGVAKIKNSAGAVYTFSGAAGGGTPTCRCYNSAAVTCTTSTVKYIPLNSERYDTDSMHFTSASNLTGTVAKTATSATLAGTGTAFLSELAVGQVISVPGTATEYRVVTAIASNTSLTVAVAFVNNASGQTATRVNSAVVARTAGKYLISGTLAFVANSTGARQISIQTNRTTSIAVQKALACTSTDGQTSVGVSTIWSMAQWEFIEMVAWQSSGGDLDVAASSPYSPELEMHWLAV